MNARNIYKLAKEKKRKEKKPISDEMMTKNGYEQGHKHQRLATGIPCLVTGSRIIVITFILFIIMGWRRRSLAGTQHLLEGGLLGGADGQAVGGLDLDPGGGVVAVDAGHLRLPLVGAFVALLGVCAGVGGPELGAVNVVGEGLALGAGPGRGAGLGDLLDAAKVSECGMEDAGREKLTIQAFFRGTMWSMETSLGTVLEMPLKGQVQDPSVG
jgi:hypothetical protein